MYSKSLELNEQYDVLPKAKSALDTVSTAAANIDANYGITAKVDEQLKISQAVSASPPPCTRRAAREVVCAATRVDRETPPPRRPRRDGSPANCAALCPALSI